MAPLGTAADSDGWVVYRPPKAQTPTARQRLPIRDARQQVLEYFFLLNAITEPMEATYMLLCERLVSYVVSVNV